MGRPKLDKKVIKGKIVPVRLNVTEVERFSKAASGYRTLSDWIRAILNRAANRELRKRGIK